MDRSLVLVGFNTVDDIENNVYLKQEYKQVRRDLNIVFGIINSIANKSRTRSMVAVLYYSILHNFLLKSGFFELDKEKYTEAMQALYTNHHNPDKKTQYYDFRR